MLQSLYSRTGYFFSTASNGRNRDRLQRIERNLFVAVMVDACRGHAGEAASYRNIIKIRYAYSNRIEGIDIRLDESHFGEEV